MDCDWPPQRETINCRCVLAVVSVDEERAEKQVQVLLDEILMSLDASEEP